MLSDLHTQKPIASIESLPSAVPTISQQSLILNLQMDQTMGYAMPS